MSIFNDQVLRRLNSNKTNPGIPINYSVKLHRYINSIQQGTSYVIGGRESGGKRSFVDLFFFIGAYMSWYTIPENIRPPLRIIYFNMDKPLHIKIQKWLCTYMWLQYGEFIDINTLNGGQNRMYDLKPDLVAKIHEAQGFFDYMFDSGILRVIDGPKHPTGFYMQATDILKEDGYLEREKYKKSEFIYNEERKNQITLIITDNADKLNAESKHGESMSSYQLHDTMVEYLEELKNVYKATPITIVPSFKVSGLSMKKDMIPDFREFQNYYRQADVAINCFNPAAYLGDYKDWAGHSVHDFITSPDNICRYRTAHIMRNTMGADNATLPYVFFPENGIMCDLPDSTSTSYKDYMDWVSKYKFSYINSKNSQE